ncbi:MAG: hypothetical protein IPF57_07545, partial [Gammaproteobacteria bacterium]|nr:hypothetical protein [Gammaproteobacteria bacterium]
EGAPLRDRRHRRDAPHAEHDVEPSAHAHPLFALLGGGLRGLPQEAGRHEIPGPRARRARAARGGRGAQAAVRQQPEHRRGAWSLRERVVRPRRRSRGCPGTTSAHPVQHPVSGSRRFLAQSWPFERVRAAGKASTAP